MLRLHTFVFVMCEINLQVSSGDDYQVAMCTRHAVLDHHRAQAFQQLLQGPLTLPDQLLNLGELLFQVHALKHLIE